MSEKNDTNTYATSREIELVARLDIAERSARIRDALDRAKVAIEAKDSFIRALTSERDAAVRVAGTLRALVDDALDELGQCELTQYSNWCIKHSSRMPCRVKAIREALDSLIATTGGSSEPQKGITE